MDKKLVCFLVVGRMGKSLTCSKAEPFVINQSIASVYIFRETESFPLIKSKYVTLPRWILNLRPLFLSKLLRVIAEPVQLVYHAWKIRPDIINGYHIIPKGINSFIAARLSGAKCIISLIGGIVEVETYSSFKWILKRLNLWALKRADLVTTKGSVVNAYLAENKVNISKALIFNGSINLKKFNYDPSVHKDIDLLFVGTFRKLKGPDRVLHILSMLKKDFPDIKACFIGDGYLYQSCIELAKNLDIDRNVTFAGQIDEPAIYFQRSKVLVMPSRSEGLPTSMLEAMASGCVPVVSDVGNIRDAARHGENSLVINSYQDLVSFTKYIKMLLSDEAQRSTMAQNGINDVRDKYSAFEQSKIVDKMIQKLFTVHGTI